MKSPSHTISRKEDSLSLTSNGQLAVMVMDSLWPLKMAGAIVCAYLLHEYIRYYFNIHDDDDDPDGYI